MNRSLWIMMMLGLAATIGLSLMMERALKVRQTRSSGPAAAAVDRACGSSCRARASYRESLRAGSRTGWLTLRPLQGVHSLRLAREAGTLAWRELGRDAIHELIVVCVEEDGGSERFRVPSPWSPGGAIVELGPEDGPAGPARVPAPPVRTPAPTGGGR